MSIELSIIMPCLNESETLKSCIISAQKFLYENQVDGEVIIADNGSTDGSQEIAKDTGVRVLNVEEKGYGSALMGGITAAQGRYIIMGDADKSYDFSSILPFLQKLRTGSDMVIGNRFQGGIRKNAMPFLHKYLGNPVLSFLGRRFFKINIGDFHCGLRGFSKDAVSRLDLQTGGMEFASEMIVKAKLNNLKIDEVPTILYKDGRGRKPHLNTWRDGWRHLRFLLLYSPKWLFFYPSVIMILIGIGLSLNYLISPEYFLAKNLFKGLLSSFGITLIGCQFLIFYALTKIYATENGLLPKSGRYDKLFEFINLERGLLLGIFLVIFAVFLGITDILITSNLDEQSHLMSSYRRVIPAVFIFILGCQILLFSLFFSILGLKKQH